MLDWVISEARGVLCLVLPSIFDCLMSLMHTTVVVGEESRFSLVCVVLKSAPLSGNDGAFYLCLAACWWTHCGGVAAF